MREGRSGFLRATTCGGETHVAWHAGCCGRVNARAIPDALQVLSVDKWHERIGNKLDVPVSLG